MKHYVTCLTIAGSDPSGGAGIEADLKTFAALGVYGMSVITAVTAQNTLGVQSTCALSPEVVTAQAEAVFSDIGPQYVKIGMLANVEIMEAVAGILWKYSPKTVVLDPVMVSTSGHKLMEPGAVEVLREKLLPAATLVTPNIPEFAVLAGCPMPHTLEEVKSQGRAFFNVSGTPLLIKGGHSLDPVCATDVLFTSDGEREFSAPRVNTDNTHGTGCTLSSAIAAFCACGLPLVEAVGEAKKYLQKALESGADVKLGNGKGPLNHFFNPRRQVFE